MNIDPWILAFSALTVGATLWMGFRSARTSKTASDFFVAGRNVSVGWNASAISGEYLSAASFMGVAGMVMSSGYDALWYPVCYACGYLFLLLFIAGPLRRFGAYTIPDFAEGRFDSPVFRKIAVVFVLFIGFFYTMPQMKGAGTTLAYIFPGLPYWVGVVLVGAVITLNVSLGGMKGITLVQAFQYWAKMFAISVPIFVLMAVYGHYGKQVGMNGVRAVQKLPFTTAAELINALSNSPTSQTPLFIRAENALTMDDAVKNVGAAKNYAKKVLRVDQYRFSTNLPMLVELREAYAFLTRKTVFYYSDKRDEGRVPFDSSLYVTSATTASVIEEIFRTNGTSIFHLNNTQAVFLAGKHLEQVNTTLATERRRLLGKAPSDDAWLNPFGPLTTKAAKAAAAAFPSNGLEQIVFLQRTNDDNISFRFEVLGKCDLRKALDHYQDLVNRRLVVDGPGLNRNNYAPPVIVDFGSEMLPIAAARQRFEAAFATNGMTLVPVGEKQFRSIKTSDLDEYRESAHLMSRKEWLAKYERPYSLLYTYSLIIALVCGTAGLPHILVRFYTNPNGVAAKRTTMWVMILIGVFYVFPPVFGVMGRNLLPGLYSGVGAKGTDKVVLELPRILNEVKGEKGEGRTESAPSPLAPRPSHFPWGSILSGITCAGAFAAFMSTFSGLLVSMTGAMAHDVYGRMLRPNSTPEQRLRAFKVCAVLIGGIAIGLGCFVEPLEINFMVGQAFAIAAASYFPLLFMSVWWRGMTMRGAASGMLIGGLCALAAVTLTNVSNLALDKGPMGKVFAGFAPLNEFWGGHPLLRILCEQPAIWTVPLAIGLMWVVSRLSARSVPRDIRMKMLVLHAPEQLGLKQEYIQEHLPGH